MKKRILISFLIYSTVVILICQVLNWIFPSEAIVYQRELSQKVLNRKDSIQSLTFGRSHGSSIDYKYWDQKGENFSMGGEDIASIKYELEFYVPRLDSLKEVLICISYSSLYFDNEALSNGNLNDARRAVYASIPSFKLISPKDYNNLVFGKMFAFMHTEYGLKELKNLISRKSKTDPFNNNAQANVVDSIEIIKSAKTQAYSHSRDKVRATQYNPNVRDQYKNHLVEIANYLKSKNVKCIFFSSPYYKEYTNRYPKADIMETEKIIRDICLTTGASYFNFSKLKSLVNDISLYANADHLNSSGHRQFSKLFSNVLHHNNSDKNNLDGAMIINGTSNY